MDSTNQFDAIRFQGVEFSTQSITLLSRRSRLFSVNKKDIRKITLKYGFQSERPLAEILFGVAIVGVVVYFFVNFLLEILVYRTVYLEELLGLLFLPVGGWFIIDGFRKRLYFEATLDNDKRKFPLEKDLDKGELQKLIRLASQLGYVIDSTFLDEMN